MQNNNRYSKYVALVALLISVIGVSLGFAAYSNTVQIKAQADVRPATGVKPAVLSTDPDNQVSGTVDPLCEDETTNAYTGTCSDGASAEPATLTENGIEDILVHFTEPGQKAVYSFYAVNPTSFESYLNEVVFATKACAPSNAGGADNAATQSYVDDACEDINMTIFVGDDEFTGTDNDIAGISMSGGTSKVVKVVIEYIPGGREADGNFDVDFGTTTVTFGTAD